MTRFVPSTLDLSRLPPPTVVKAVDFEAILAARISDLSDRLAAAGIAWDVGGLQSDPFKILEQVDAYREMLDLSAINDAARGVLLPHAQGGDLDVLGSLFGVERLEGEEHEAYRRRIALAPEAYTSAGSRGAYEFHARAVSARVTDVGVTSPSTGVARVVILSDERPGEPASADLVAAVRARLLSDEIRPLTDQVVVMAAAITSYEIAVHLVLPPGPDPAVIVASTRAALASFAADCHRVGRGIDPSETVGAAWSANVRRVHLGSPSAGIPADPLRAPWCSAITVTTEVGHD